MNPAWVALFCGETISGLALIGAVIVIAAILVYNVQLSRRGRQRKLRISNINRFIEIPCIIGYDVPGCASVFSGRNQWGFLLIRGG